MTKKTLNNTDVKGAKTQVKDIEIFGDGDTFKLICKASSKNEGWMKSTKAMEVGNGCVIQVTTQQQNPDGSYSIAEALTFVPKVRVYAIENEEGVIIERALFTPTIFEKIKEWFYYNIKCTFCKKTN
jgi:hypothetical protein